MFESIKLRIIQGAKLKPFATAKVLQDHEDRLKALESSEGEPSKYDLRIVVNDGSDAVEGATVSIGTITGTTGSAGGCTLSQVTEGSQNINVVADGYEAYQETITVDSSHTEFTISLTAN